MQSGFSSSVLLFVVFGGWFGRDHLVFAMEVGVCGEKVCSLPHGEMWVRSVRGVMFWVWTKVWRSCLMAIIGG